MNPAAESLAVSSENGRTETVPKWGRGLLISLALALAFLAGSAFQSAATLAYRVRGNSVMQAASGAIWTGQIGRDILNFVAAQLLLHGAMAILVWGLACSTAAFLQPAREKFGRFVVLWFCLIVIAAIAFNAYWFPRTGLGAYYHDALATKLGPFPVGPTIYWIVTVLAGLTIVTAAVSRLKRISFSQTRLATQVVPLLLVVGLVSLIAAGGRIKNARATHAQKPNVILLGVDSLRLEQLRRFGGSGLTPNLDGFIKEADIVRDTTTPLGRTYPSWVAILTGRDPLTTGARFNLAERTLINASPTLGQVLQKQGYRTVYATDEVRFANIDESFGFDQVITPPIGASDFLIGTYNELPLASVVVNTRLGQMLFPFSYGNRGVAALFQPESYLSRLERELSFEEPTLLITHLTASHWPYYVSDTRLGVGDKKYEDDRPLYRIGLETVDEMFGAVTEILRRKGAFENAIVVVLSDHGEALALNHDTMINNQNTIEGLRFPLLVNDLGHGQSVLSPVQYQVLLGFRSFGKHPGFTAGGRDIQGGATVEDIAPTVLDLLGVSGDPLSTTGASFAHVLQQTDSANHRVGSPDRVRFTETDLRVLPDTDGGVDEVATANENSKFFRVDWETGRLNIRSNYVPLVIAFKERAAFTDRLLLAALPAGPKRHQYLLLSRQTGNGKLLMARPSGDEPEAQHLWDAMNAYYGAELKEPTAVTAEDLPDIDRGWEQFFSKSDPPTIAAR